MSGETHVKTEKNQQHKENIERKNILKKETCIISKYVDNERTKKKKTCRKKQKYSNI